jgi:hypothetical protein
MVFVWIPASLWIASGFSAIRFHSFLSFFEYIPFPTFVNNCFVILTVTMVPATQIYEQSNKLYRDLKSHQDRNKLHRKQLAVLKPFGVRVGLVHVVKRVAILFSYYFISNNIFTMLVTFPADAITP